MGPPCGTHPAESLPDFRLDLSSELATSLHLRSEKDLQELQLELENLQGLHNLRRTFDPGRASNEARRHLKKLGKQINEFIRALEQIDGETQYWLIIGFEYIEKLSRIRRLAADGLGSSGQLMLGTALADLRRLGEANRCAIAHAPGRQGRANVDVLRELCIDLSYVYERWSGRDFTFDVHRQKGRPIEFLTDGACWVALAAELLDPNVTKRNLATAMRSISRQIKGLHKRPP
jgi:hypothetical protein